MQKVSVPGLVRAVKIAAVVLGGLLVLATLLAWRMWQIRGSVDDIGWPQAITASEPGEAVTVTWLGISTLLFDDGETQVLIDGVFTRVGAVKSLLLRPVRSDVATINYAMAKYAINRLAAVIPVHSHHDHAIDVGHIANRSTAVILGSESTSNIARGASVPVDQYQTLADGESRQFGDFTIELVASRHAPIGPDDREIFPGIIEEPLRQPARISEYRTGVVWSVIVSHPRGTTLVHGSSGFVEGKLQGKSADVVMLGIAGLADLGEAYVARYWQETVEATGASRVIAIHHDDFTAPFETVRLLPDMLDKVLVTTARIDALVAAGDENVSTELPPLGKPIILY